MTAPIIRARSLRRTFRTFERRPGVLGAMRDLFRVDLPGRTGTTITALSGLDLDVEAGSRIAIIGPNGAGKSTTIKLFCGILSPTQGSVEVCGLTPDAQRQAHVRHIGVVMGQRTQLWWDLAVLEAYELLARIFEVPRSDFETRLAELDAALDIGRLLRLPVRELSLGQRVRCDIAASLLHGPKILFLDEPTIGLDVAVKLRLRAFLRQLNESQGTTIVLTTHDLTDVEAVCDRVVLLHQGQVLFDDTPDSLKADLGGQRQLQVTLDRPLSTQDQQQLVTGLPDTVVVEHRDQLLCLRFAMKTSGAQVVSHVLDRAAAANIRVADLHLQEPDIDQVVARFYEAPDAIR